MPTSSASLATRKAAAGPGLRSPADCAPSPGSTGTRWRKTCSITLQPRTTSAPTCRKPPRMPTRARRGATTAPAAASTGTRHTSSRPTLPEPPGKDLAADLHPGGGLSLPADGHAELVDRGGHRMAGTDGGLSDEQTSRQTTAWVTDMPARLRGCTVDACRDQPSKPRAHPSMPLPAAAQRRQAITAGPGFIRLSCRARGRQTGPVRTFKALVTEGSQVTVDGWDFSWFEGRATEQPPRGYRLGSRG